MKPSFAFVASTSGSVMNEALHSETLRARIHSAVVLKGCSAEAKARKHRVPVHVIDAASNQAFCARLLDYLNTNSIDYVLSFYDDFYTDDLRTAYSDRIVNFHPSILPAFKGMNGFGDGLDYHCKLIGSTVELIKDVMDEGKIVMQSAFPADPNHTVEMLRHRLFVQQCKSLLQVVDWIASGRMIVDGMKVTIRDARHCSSEFAPALELPEAINLDIPCPE